ncbi:MAG: S4 domain-containing protein [archaeon]|nr:S4 domain-containing protein [archaeon]
MHIKRKTIGKFWPVPRTGTKYMTVPSHEQNSSLPLIAVMRDVLKLVKTNKELKKLLNEKKVQVNGKVVNELKYPLALFDTLGFPSVKKFYRVSLKNKFELVPIKEAEANSKIYEVINKRILPNKKVQLNLNQGRNILSNEKLEVGDYVVVDLAKNKITKVVSLKKDVPVLVIAGKHSGVEGKIKDIVVSGDQKVAIIKTSEGEVKSNLKNIFAVEE